MMPLLRLKNIKGVRDVMDMVSVEAADPVMGDDYSDFQQKVADAIKDFPSVKMDVVNGEITLTGEVTAEQARKIKMSVDALKVGKVNYDYNVKNNYHVITRKYSSVVSAAQTAEINDLKVQEQDGIFYISGTTSQALQKMLFGML